MPIIFSEADRRFSLGERRKIKSFIENILCVREGRSIGTLSYVFCSDDFLLDINIRFLKHDLYTDIITFDLGSAANVTVDGEVYISIDRVRENALNLDMQFRTELLRVLFHGILHLCGHSDKTIVAKAKMRALEDNYLCLYNDFAI